MPTATILCIDDARTTDILRHALGREGYGVETAWTGRRALQLLDGGRPDLVVLGVNLPDLDGLHVLTALRERSAVPVIMLTARRDDDAMLDAFELGADDCVAKPLHVALFVARAKALLRRSAQREGWASTTAQQSSLPPGETYDVHGATFDARRHELIGPGDEPLVRLTPTESRILHLLLQHQGHVISPEGIIERLRGCATAPATPTSSRRTSTTYARRSRVCRANRG